MGAPRWKNIYELSPEQIEKLEEAEDKMESMEITESEIILLGLLEGDENCIPVLNILGHLHGRYLSDFEAAIEYYDRVLELEPDNAWARDERRRYRRYVTYD
jgi:tetratricopeptide (TPR) repeat protein